VYAVAADFAHKQREENIRPEIVMSGEKKNLPDNGALNGRYSNYFKIGHNPFEFLFDFGQIYAGDAPAPLHTRIVTTPFYAKHLLALLRQSIAEYERLFGTIPDGDK
jgi:hypothetical protein